MKKRFVLILAAVLVALSGMAEAFSYLKLSSAAGDKTISTDGLRIEFNNGNLVAVSSAESATIALSAMNYMEFTNTPGGDTPSYPTGDVTGDGKVDVADVNAIINIILKTKTQADYPGNADLDNDGKIDVSDVNNVINIILRIDSSNSPRRAEATEAQTMWVVTGLIKWAFTTSQLSQMPYTDGTTLTVQDKVFNIADIDYIYVDNNEWVDSNIDVAYSSSQADVIVAGNIASHITGTVTNAHVCLLQDATLAIEPIYTLAGTTTNGSFYMDGSYKATVKLNGLTLTNPDSAAVNIRNGKRIEVQVVDGTTNSLVDGSNGSQKACLAIKGHTEFKGNGTLNITGNTAHGFWGKEYVEVKKTFGGTINILKAVGDGFNVNQYFKQNGGNIIIKNVGDDGLQVSFKTDDDGNIIEDTDNTGIVTIAGGSINITTAGNGVKGIKSEGDVIISGGTTTITQTGSLDTSGSSLSYSTAVKAAGDINVTGGTITVNNTADGGKGLSADGNLTIDETAGTTIINIKANGIGGTAEATGTSTEEPAKSYRIYVAKPTSSGGYPGGGSNAWSNIYLYKSDGTLVANISSNTVQKSSGYSTLTFYYYDFKAADNGTYYFKSDNYTSGGGWGGGTSYTIQTVTFSGPTTGEDIYYQIGGYSTSGTTRTYQLSNVTATYGGTSDLSEDNGTSYNAAGLKADGDLIIDGGTITVENSGAMSKSIKSKATCTINGGDVTLTPSGAMKVINSDASYSSGIKAVDFVMNGGTLKITSSGVAGKGISTTNVTTNGGTITINNSGTAQAAGTSGDYYTAKGIKTDGNLNLLGGSITIKMTGTGGKGIKVNGAFVQGNSDGTGPALVVSTTGSAAGTSSGGGWGGPGGGGGVSGSAKAIKVLGTITLNGGTSEVTTATNGAEGIESKTSITINGGKHYYKAYDDGMNCDGFIKFAGGLTIVYSFGNDAIDSNYGHSGAIEIGNGAVVAYTSKGAPEEGFDCDNNSYITITGNGYAVSAGASQGGGGGLGGSSGIGSAVQGYCLSTSSLSYSTGRYYTFYNGTTSMGFTYSMETGLSSSLSLFTCKGMTKGGSYNIKYSTSAPTGATSSWHGVYIGGTPGTSSGTFTSFTAN